MNTLDSAFIPTSMTFLEAAAWKGGKWIFRAHLPWEDICDLTIKKWLKENCSGKFMLQCSSPYLNTYNLYLESKEDAALFTLQWL